MYPGQHARLRPLQPAFIMAATGEAVTYRELDARSNRLAHLFRRHGLKRLDHYSIFMENNSHISKPALRASAPGCIAPASIPFSLRASLPISSSTASRES